MNESKEANGKSMLLSPSPELCLAANRVQEVGSNMAVACMDLPYIRDA